jgi:hypothetical protein
MRPPSVLRASDADRESRRTIKLDDRANDAICLDEIERMLIQPTVSTLVSAPEGLLFGVGIVAGRW